MFSSYFVPFECPLTLLNCIIREKPQVLNNSGIGTGSGLKMHGCFAGECSVNERRVSRKAVSPRDVPAR